LKQLRLLIAVLLLAGIGILSWHVYLMSTTQRALKEDLIELSKIQYGLFSVDTWKNIIADVVTKKIEEFDLQGSDREVMRKKIEELLYQLLDDFEANFYKDNSRSLKGFFRSVVADFTGTFSDMKKNVPGFTEQILDFMNDPENRDAMRAYIIGKVNDYADKTFSEQDYTVHDRIIAAQGYTDRQAAISGLTGNIATLEAQTRPYSYALLILAACCGIFMIILRNITKFESLIFTFTCMALLITGLLLPMIEIDARISEMNFTMLGEPLSFIDQVLYYKSKSILEVVHLMITQHKADLLLIGLLVLTFSVLFPITKLLSSVIYLFSTRVRSSAFFRFMIFRTGKWSMADVMVIAIFMAYIGFTGIISEQLRQIEGIAPNLDIVTTNKSSLLMGFFTFTAFAILSLLLSHKLQYNFRTEKP